MFFGLRDNPSGLASIGFLPSGDPIEGTRITALDNELTEPPATFRLHGNYPNPFNPSTAIRYELDKPAHITLTVHDALGREVVHLVDGRMPSGSHTATWDTGETLPSGAYFVTLSTGVMTQTHAAVLLR